MEIPRTTKKTYPTAYNLRKNNTANSQQATARGFSSKQQKLETKKL